MAQNKITLPSSGGGIVRYDAERSSNVVMTPEVVVGICVAVIIGLIILSVMY